MAKQPKHSPKMERFFRRLMQLAMELEGTHTDVVVERVTLKRVRFAHFPSMEPGQAAVYQVTLNPGQKGETVIEFDDRFHRLKPG